MQNSYNNDVHPCTTILIGREASADGSVLMATSCDGNIMGRVYVVAEKFYPEDAKVKMFFDFLAPATWKEHEDQIKKGYTFVGYLPIEHTYRCIFTAGHFADSITGGINEHGLSMGIEYIGMNPILANKNGVVSTCSNHWTTSIIANGLLRAKTAREAIKIMGSMLENYGFTYYWAPDAGCAIPIVDKNEAWIMEIFGPGKDWKPGSMKLGAVWCAQRVPDGEVTCNANRSRIGEVNLDDEDHFMASANIYSLAEEIGLWDPKRPFIWYEVYGTVGGRENSLREWAILNLHAPSLGLKATGDPSTDRYPFSVKPDRKVSVQSLKAIMRDYYQGTQFDVTEHPSFNPRGSKSPLASPFGPQDLFDLIGIRPERCISSETSGYVYISQIRNWLPDPISGCMWFTLGPSFSSCFAPIYSGVTEIVSSWSRSPNFTRIDRSQVQWKFRLVTELTRIKFQEAIKDVSKVFESAEEELLSLQGRLEDEAVLIFNKNGKVSVEEFVTRYSNSCLENVDSAYNELVDYLMFNYLYSYSSVAPPKLPKICLPHFRI